MITKIADKYAQVRSWFQLQGVLRRGRKLQATMPAPNPAYDLSREINAVGEIILQTRLDSVEYRARKLIEQHAPDELDRFDRDIAATRDGVRRLAGTNIQGA